MKRLKDYKNVCINIIYLYIIYNFTQAKSSHSSPILEFSHDLVSSYLNEFLLLILMKVVGITLYVQDIHLT